MDFYPVKFSLCLSPLTKSFGSVPFGIAEAQLWFQLRRFGLKTPKWHWKLEKYFQQSSRAACLELDFLCFDFLFLSGAAVGTGSIPAGWGGSCQCLVIAFSKIFLWNQHGFFGYPGLGWSSHKDGIARSFPGEEGRVCPKGFGTSALNPGQGSPSQLCHKISLEREFSQSLSDRIRRKGFKFRLDGILGRNSSLEWISKRSCGFLIPKMSKAILNRAIPPFPITPCPCGKSLSTPSRYYLPL